MIYPHKQISATIDAEVDDAQERDAQVGYAIVVPVANPDSQQGLLRLAVALALPEKKSARIYPVNLVRLGDEYSYDSLPEQTEQLVAESQLRLNGLITQLATHPELIHPLSQVSDDVPGDLCRIAQARKADLVLLGWHRPTFTQDLLGGNVRPILEAATSDVAVFIDRGFTLEAGTRIVVPYASTVHDRLALELALRLAITHGAKLTILQATPLSRETRDLVSVFQERLPIEIGPLMNDPLNNVVEVSRRADLVVVGTSPQWGLERHIFGKSTDELAARCHSSILIVKHHKGINPHIESLLAEQNTASLTANS